jgi:hypothetical protein
MSFVPYLFVLAINELAIAPHEAMSTNCFVQIMLGSNCPPIHSLLFVGDLLVCEQAREKDAISIKQILQ